MRGYAGDRAAGARDNPCLVPSPRDSERPDTSRFRWVAAILAGAVFSGFVVWATSAGRS
jgi:hypothetical protein